MVCSLCGTEVMATEGTETEGTVFSEACKKCGKIFCLNCLRDSTEKGYICKECLINK